MMKRFSINTLIVTVMAGGILSGAIDLSAQEYTPTPVTVSTNKLKVDGKLCYSHIVLERQTLYSICKAYNVTAEDLYKYNPGLKENGLKKNGILIIPAVSTEVKETPAPQKADTVTVHAPAPAPKKTESNKANSPKYLKHTVKWYETDINDIAEKYGVSAEAIMQANNLKSAKLTSRQKLLIPESTAQETHAVAATAPKEEIKETADTTGTQAPEQEYTRKDDVTFALMLPMGATGSSSKRSYMDFYSGVLLGVYDCAQKGISTDLRVHDVAEGNLPEQGFLNGCDFAIGPVYRNDILTMLDSGNSETMIISPLDQRAESLLSKYGTLIQAPTERIEQYKDLVEWLKEETLPQDHVIYISETHARDTAAVNAMKKVLDGSGIPYKKFSYSILQGRDITEPLLEQMTVDGTNRFIIESESEAWVNDVVRNLNLLKKEADVVLYSPSKIRTFETIEAEYFHNITLRVSLSYNVDYSSDEVKQFIMKYRALFMTEPTQFAYQGYDLSTYFINLIHKYGNDWRSKITEEEGKMLQSTLKFVKDGEGYSNVGIRRVQYMPDKTIKDVR